MTTIVSTTAVTVSVTTVDLSAAVHTMLLELPLTRDMLPRLDVEVMVKAVAAAAKLTAWELPHPFKYLYEVATDSRRTEGFLVLGLRRNLNDTLVVLQRQAKANTEAAETLTNA